MKAFQYLKRLVAFAASVVGVSFALALPAQDAHAMSAFEALDTVCKQVQGLCGGVDQYPKVYKTCFESSDELGCVIGIIDVSQGGALTQGKQQIDAIVACVKAALPIKPECDQYLQAAGYSGSTLNEAYALINQCAAIKDVDDAIVCADALLDSKIAKDNDLEVPTWVNSLFDIYMDIRDKDYWSLVYHVGATVACAVAQYYTGNDVCAFLQDLYEVGKAVVDAFGAIVDFFEDLLGGGGGTTYKVNGKQVTAIEFMTVRFGSAPENPGGVANSVKQRLAGDYLWQEHKKAVIEGLKTGPFKMTGFDQNTYDNAWTLYATRDVYPTWDKEIREKVIPARKAAMDQYVAGLNVEELIKQQDDGQRFSTIVLRSSQCHDATGKLTTQMIEWTKQGRPAPGEGVGELYATCGYRIAQKLLTGIGANSCEFKGEASKEAVTSALCKTAASMNLCLSASQALTDKTLKGCSFGSPQQEAQAAAASLGDFAKLLNGKNVKCVWGALANDANAMRCDDPAHNAGCTKEMAQLYGRFGWPKAGIAECRVVATDQRKAVVAAAAKVAQMLPESFNLPGVSQGQVKTHGGNVKVGSCEQDKHDAAVIRCQVMNFPLKKSHVDAIANAVAPIRISGCNAQEEQTNPTKAWLTEPCVATGGKFFVENAVTIAAQAGAGTQALSGSNITAPGAGSGSAIATAAPGKSSAAQQPGINAPLNPGVGQSGSNTAALTGQLTSPGAAAANASAAQAASQSAAHGNFKAAPPPPPSPAGAAAAAVAASGVTANQAANQSNTKAAPPPAPPPPATPAAAVAASGQTANQAGSQGNFTSAPPPAPAPGSATSGGSAAAAQQAASKAGAGNSPGGWASGAGSNAAAGQGWTGGSGSGQSEVDKQLEKAGCKPVSGQQKAYACTNPQGLQICDGLKKQGKVNLCKPG